MQWHAFAVRTILCLHFDSSFSVDIPQRGTQILKQFHDDSQVICFSIWTGTPHKQKTNGVSLACLTIHFRWSLIVLELPRISVDVIGYNNLIGAHAQDAQWRGAIHLLAMGSNSDAISHLASWRRAGWCWSFNC